MTHQPTSEGLGPSPQISSQPGGPSLLEGIDAFLAAVEGLAAQVYAGRLSTAQALLRLGDDYAYIRLRDLAQPLRFLRQMAGAPPVRLGTAGFRRSLVDDENPARHYTAFLLVGYWLPRWAARWVLWGWEIAGFVRYGGKWSVPDMASGMMGVRHGRLVRRYGLTVLPGLAAAELAEPSVCPPPMGRSSGSSGPALRAA
ncbi:MAG: hypothetical protein IT329_13345 [Caldilineaceae bacterium]|nr:hypothetical protein [Caldilineaceae bacterium]